MNAQRLSGQVLIDIGTSIYHPDNCNGSQYLNQRSTSHANGSILIDVVPITSHVLVQILYNGLT